MSTFKPCSTRDLSSSEQRFLAAMRELSFGRFEYVQIRKGELILDPGPVAVRDVKFGAGCSGEGGAQPEFQLKRQVAEFFEYTRDVDDGEIRTLEVKSGLPFSMEIDLARGRRNG